MPAYGNIDSKIAGLKQGLESRVMSLRVAEAAGIDYGYPVFGYVGNDTDIFLYHNNRAKLAFDADFVTSNSIVVTVDGTAVTAVPFNTDHDTTMADLIAQIEADIAGSSVALDPADTDDRTIFITIEDDDDRVVTEAITGGSSQATGTITEDSTMVFKGFSMFTQQENAQKVDADGNVITAGDAKYDEKDAANIMIDGWIVVVTGAAVNSGNAAYAIATGATQGKVDDLSTNNIALNGVVFDETVAAAGLAIVRINK